MEVKQTCLENWLKKSTYGDEEDIDVKDVFEDFE